MSRFRAALSFLGKQFSEGRATRDLLSLLGGVMGARVIQVLAIPLITRLFDPADYGRVSLLVALATTFNQASSLGYEGAIALPRQGHGARQVSRLSLLLLLGFCITLALIAAQWPEAWRPAGLNSVPGWWLILAAIVGLLGLSNVLQAWAVRRKAFQRIAASSLAQAGVTSSGRVAWGLGLSPTFLGLLMPYVVGLVVRAWSLIGAPSSSNSPAPGDPVANPPPPDQADPWTIGEAARRYAAFALFGLPSTLIRSLTQRLPLLLIGTLFAPAIVGFYAAAHRLVLTPARAIGQAGRQVALPRAAGRRRRAEPMFWPLARATTILGLAAVVPCALLYVIGEPLLVFVLGDGWTSAGPYAPPLAPWAFTMFLTGPTSAVFQALEKQRWMLGLSCVRLALFVVAVLWARASDDGDPLLLVVSLAIAGVLANMLQLALGLWLAWRHDQNLPCA
ncbi:MAG: lipopolysaccharide biosynthesis protein [Pseudomonadota bacterium]